MRIVKCLVIRHSANRSIRYCGDYASVYRTRSTSSTGCSTTVYSSIVPFGVKYNSCICVPASKWFHSEIFVKQICYNNWNLQSKTWDKVYSKPKFWAGYICCLHADVNFLIKRVSFIKIHVNRLANLKVSIELFRCYICSSKFQWKPCIFAYLHFIAVKASEVVLFSTYYGCVFWKFTKSIFFQIFFSRSLFEH